MYSDNDAREILKGKNLLTDEWQLLYAIYRIKNKELPERVSREISIHEEACNLDLYKEFQQHKSHRVDTMMSVVLKRYKELSITLGTKETKWLKERVKGVFKQLDNNEKPHKISKESLKNTMVNAIGFLLTEGKGNHKSKETKNREYHGLTQLLKGLRCMIPLIYLSIDLVSANPQIIDKLLGCKKGLFVYQNLMDKRGISRDKAKKLFNMTLNRHYLTIEDAMLVYMDCGYNDDEALRLAQMTTRKKKGEFYEVMTAIEKKLMKNYSNELTVESYRFHDALIVNLESVEYQHITLPTFVKGYNYHFTLFNDDSIYIGLTNDIQL